ncbi:MAG: MoaD/ThiS family protein [Cellulophaga sp.]|nr:MoaD/ThiS family protein [Cellulophaga sp.]
MTIEINYFGMIAEVTGCNSERMSVSEGAISDLKGMLVGKYPALKNKDFRMAQNQELVSEDTLLTGQEIALLPPFAGG